MYAMIPGSIHSLKFTSGVTLADLLMASTVASHFSHSRCRMLDYIRRSAA